jgi:hypothetical protein
MLRADRPLVSRVREIRTHGLNGGSDRLACLWGRSSVRVYQ